MQAEAGTIKAQVLADADGEVSYIKDCAEHGCIGGSCNNLIYYKDTHAFTVKHLDEINEMLNEAHDNIGESPLAHAETTGDLFNWLAWFAYEVRAQEIISELEETE